MVQLAEIKPSILVKLDTNEKVYAEFIVNRAGMIDSTTTSSNHSSGIGRAVTGGVLFGGVGAIAGAITASKKGTSTSVASNVLQIIDQGILLLTDKRFIFVGQDFISIPYNKIQAINFTKLSLSEDSLYRQMLVKNKSLSSYNNPLSKYRLRTFSRALALSVNYEDSMMGEKYLIVSKNKSEAQKYYSMLTNDEL